MASTKPSDVLRQNIFFAEKDKALREDVHRLGELVGELVQEQAGEALYDLVEAARQTSIAHREGDGEAFAQLRTLLGALEPSTARDFIRAFSTYFQMVNMAEKVHRIRRRRAYLRDASTHQPFSFLDVLERLKAKGVDADRIEEAITDACVEPVFTAHPTEAARRTLLRKQQNIARHLVDTLDPYMTPQEYAATLGQIRMEMTTGWQTEEHPGERMQIGDEAEHILFFLTDVLYRMIPPFYENLEDALAEIYPERGALIRLPVLVKFSTWVGGDMDGNPNVTAKSIRETLARHRALALDLYYRECGDLAMRLSQCSSRVGVADELLRRIELYAGHFPQAAHAVPARHRNMPYRVFSRLIQARLKATAEDNAFPYESPEEFIADVDLIADSLRANKGRNAGLFSVRRLLRRAQTFGFHIATLDIRQNALVHRRVIGEALGEPHWLELDSERRTMRLKEALERRESPIGSLSSEARRTLAVFQAIAHSRRKYGRRAIGPYIVSMAHGPDDVLSVLLLARWGHLGPKGGAVPLDVAPLFETAEDLENASAIMERLLADDYYRAHLKERGGRQMVMVGYSGGNKEGGLVWSRWTLHMAQRELVETSRRLGLKLTLFHGRGGTISRGSGRLHEAVMAAPAGAVAGPLRFTEQGETINAKYGLRAIALRSLEQTLSSVLRVSAAPPQSDPRERRWQAVMQDIAEHSRRVYKQLVFDSSFLPYFREATPIDVIEHLGFGARAGTGDDGPSIETMRAVPWAFAWTQNRCLLHGWYGFGTGLEHALETHGGDVLKEMLAEWYFFRVLTSDVEAALAKADLDITERYSHLAGSLHDAFFPAIRSEYQRCARLVLELSGQGELLERSDTLRRAIRLRNPYVDPMSFLQVDLLERWRAAGSREDAMLQALMVSVHGIAHAMQNTV